MSKTLIGLRGPAALLVLCLLLASAAQAVIETYEFSNADLERRYHELSQELRCPKCQNQNIADSNAPISQDLRQLLYARLEAGASDQEILDDMVARYGEFVRYRPSAQGVTLWLWLAPALMLACGLVLLVVLLRRRSEPPEPISDAERERLNAMLTEKDSAA